jgi:hypothetical protein
MTSTSLSRRDRLKGTVVLAAVASVGVATTTRWRRAEAQESTVLPRARIDGVLRQAVDAKDVPCSTKARSAHTSSITVRR